jgi:hypothetical protein
MNKIIERGGEDGETIYLKKGFDGWRVVYPIKNKDGSWNWKHILTGGSWWNWAKIGGIVLIIVLAFVEWQQSLEYCSEFIADYNTVPMPHVIDITKINFSNITVIN